MEGLHLLAAADLTWQFLDLAALHINVEVTPCVHALTLFRRQWMFLAIVLVIYRMTLKAIGLTFSARLSTFAEI